MYIILLYIETAEKSFGHLSQVAPIKENLHSVYSVDKIMNFQKIFSDFEYVLCILALTIYMHFFIINALNLFNLEFFLYK